MLERRLDLVTGVCRSEPDLNRTAEVSIAFCLLEDLRDKGPFAPVFIEPERPDEPVDWLGQSNGRASERATEATEEG